MAQVSRAYKFEVPVLVRVLHGNYNQQRRGYSYYDILRVSPNATQKEIKDAYIKLSKKMHPDMGNKGSHNDFVKLNEAYKVLSKSGSRSLYDNDLKYYHAGTRNSYQKPGSRRQNYYQQGPHQAYGSYQKYNSYYRYGPFEQHSYNFGQWDSYARRTWGPVKKATPQDKRRAIIICVTTAFVGLLLQIWHVKRWIEVQQLMAMERSMKLQTEYDMIKENSRPITVDEQMERYEEWNKKYNYFGDYK